MLAVIGLADAAAGTRLDDSLSPKRRMEVSSRWENSPGASGDAFYAVIAEVPNSEIRLNTAPYVGRRAEIYLVLPINIAGLATPGALRAEWRTRGAFQSGTAIPGQRTLVYRGPITERVMGDFFDFTYRIDARHFDKRLQFDSHFEIDVLP